MTPVARAAVLYAEQLKLAVFPVAEDCRSPMIKRGCHAASSDPAVVAEMFASRPRANVAAALGAASGAFVLDVDNKINQPGFESLERLQLDYGALPPSWESQTPSDGRHLWFAQPPHLKLRNRVSLSVTHPDGTRSIYAGLDIRSTAGSACLPPSRKPSGPYRWLRRPSETPLAPAPAWLLSIIDPPPPPRKPVPRFRMDSADKAARYVAAAVDRECRDLAGMKANTGRNLKLFQAAANLGGLVGAGLLPQGMAEAALEDAAQACGLTHEDGIHAVRQTIASGMTRGLARPREVQL